MKLFFKYLNKKNKKEEQRRRSKQKPKHNIAYLNPTLPIFTLHVSGINISIISTLYIFKNIKESLQMFKEITKKILVETKNT